ncbi:nucleoporin NDC1 [Pieris brassicae]|uniref:nucleoporin NDC1 n=1 Tax=Pieris brassicae TaxID=7116 RepID=UPI001E65F587|nr:nucleoporin NDC1 [Pieris brassicae]
MGDKNEIFSERLVKAVIWDIALQTFLATLLVFIIQIDVIHPLSWITSTLEDIISWKMLLNVILLGLVSFFQAYIYGKYYTSPVPKYFTRFSMFLNIFTTQNLVFTLLYALNGYFTLILYSSLAKSNFNVLKKMCEDSDGQCLNEQSLFLQLGGMWIGLFYFLSAHIFNKTVLTFPHIYQDKFQQMKLVITNVVATGFQRSMKPVGYFCVFYYFWGNKPRSVVSDVYSIYLEDPPLDNIINMLRSGIWIGLWFYASLFFISVNAMRAVFNIVLTEPMVFSIESDKNLTLCSALAQKSQFTGFLGAQDFRILAMTDQSRRLQIFTLSQPGGHPRNWNGLLENSLIIIKEFSNQLEAINSDSNVNGIKDVSKRNLLNESPKSSPIGYSGSLRNMASYPQALDIKNIQENKEENTFVVGIKKEFNNFVQRLCQKPGINYFFGELTDTKLKFILLQAQPVMWTCEGLAHIVAYSLKEDKYGVVQNDLPIILSALINLKQNLEKLSKPGLIPRKQILNDSFAIRSKTAILSVVKRSIYKIVITFSKYIHEIPLDPDVQLAIQPFLVCKEP